MTTGKLVTNLELTELCDAHLNLLNYPSWQLVATIARENLNINNFSAFTVLQIQRRIFYIFCFFSEDCAQEAFFWRKVCLSLIRNFSNQDITRSYFCTNSNHAFFIQITKLFFAHAWNIARYHFCAQFCVAHVNRKVFNMNRAKAVIFYYTFRNNDGIFKVVTVPRHECN